MPTIKTLKRNISLNAVFNENESIQNLGNDTLRIAAIKDVTNELTTGIVSFEMPASITTSAIKRIGEKKEYVISQRPDSCYVKLANKTKVGGITLIGNDRNIKEIDKLKQGKNVKNTKIFNRMITPLITINNNPVTNRADHVIEHDYKESSFGYVSDRNAGEGTVESSNVKAMRFFRDRLHTLDPVNYIRQGKYVLGYPIVNDNIMDFDSFNNPDALQGDIGGVHRDGSIEVFEIRKAKANTNSADIQINGIRASMYFTDQESGQLSDKKGSSIVDVKYEFEQSDYDWFEDCQDRAFSDKIFPEVGNINSSNREMSFDGYISDGKYLIAPFKDESPNNNKYEILNKDQTLLLNSNRNISEIGYRFKSMQNGFILSPSQNNESTIKTVLGTDSIAFRSYLRG